MLPEGNYTPAATCFQAVLTGRLRNYTGDQRTSGDGFVS
jgi:hypothetical protein